MRAAGGLAIAGAVLLFAEGAARFAGPQIPEWQGADQGSVVMGGHPTRLWGMNTGERQVGSVRAFINDRGLRGRLPELPRPEGRHRIMLVGDSTFFGHGIADDETIIARTAALYAEQGLDVDAVNGGIPGYSTDQTRLLMDEVGWDLEPTLLLIGNLWSDNNFDHFRDADLLRTRKLWMENPLSRSSLFLVVASVLDGFGAESDARVVTWMRTAELPDHGVRRVPLQAYAHNLDAMVRQAAARGIQAGIVSPVNRQMSEGVVIPNVAWDPFFDAQAAVARHHNIPHIRLAPTIIEAAKTHGGADLYLDEMHPTPLGATYFARGLHQGLTDWGWPDTPALAQGGPFDPSGLEDFVKGGVPLTVNELSPQANLYPNAGHQKRASADGQDKPKAEAYWEVAGKVVGAPAKVNITVTTAQGKTLNSVALDGTDSFALKVPVSTTLAKVMASLPNGRSVSADCFQGCDAITLRFE